MFSPIVSHPLPVVVVDFCAVLLPVLSVVFSPVTNICSEWRFVLAAFLEFRFVLRYLSSRSVGLFAKWTLRRKVDVSDGVAFLAGGVGHITRGVIALE